MSFAIVGGAAIIGTAGVIGTAIANAGAEDAANTQAAAAGQAADTQSAAALASIEEQKRQFDAMQAVLKPYTDAGITSLSSQQDLAGLNGAEKQRAAIAGIAGSAEMQAMTQQGENAMLQNASATGGLRGGNIQGALAQYRPQVLSSLINQQYGRLSGITQMGQASAAGVGAAGMQTGANIGNTLMQSGNAQAQGILGAGNAQAQAQLAQAQNWGNLPNQIVQGGLLGYGLSNPGAF